MRLRFFSDPHLGLVRTSHTTQDSRKRLAKALFESALLITASIRPTFCLGDLFDSYSNYETVIEQGLVITDNCVAVLAGNHDSSNRADTLSSLQLIHNLRPEKVWGDFTFHEIPEASTVLVAVPHQLSQEAFEDKLQRACEGVDKQFTLKVLLLHCNYNSGYADAPTALNLTRERAEFLLETFDYVLIGHEHVSRIDFNGKLVLLGNIHPTSFADISDKFYWELNTETRTLHRLLCWEVIDGYKSFNVNDESFDELNLDEVQFLDIVGQATPAQMPTIAKAVNNLWREGKDLLMVRMGVIVEGEEVPELKLEGKLDVVDRIRSELKGNELEVFNQYVEGCSHG